MDYKDLEHIDIPEGLEQRLSTKIDEWELTEQKEKRIRTRRTLRTVITAAACVAVALGIGWHFLAPEHSELKPDIAQNNGEQDTYTDPDQAYAEAEKALQLLAYNINKGINHLNRE